MPSVDLVQELIKSHKKGDDAAFDRACQCIVANEKAAGHAAAAARIEKAASGPKSGPQVVQRQDSAREAFEQLDSLATLDDLVLPERLRSLLQRVVYEQRSADRLAEHGLRPRRKLLLVGAPGCGKTMTAQALANDLELNMYALQASKIVDSLFGKTAQNIRNAFIEMTWERAVYLFDEFDGIACRRGGENEVGEMRRVVNTLLQLIERDRSEGIIVAATNDAAHIDRAFIRRFDDVLEYPTPTTRTAAAMVEKRLACYDVEPAFEKLSRPVADVLSKLSYAEICRVADDAVKEHVLHDAPLDEPLLLKMAHADSEDGFPRE